MTTKKNITMKMLTTGALLACAANASAFQGDIGVQGYLKNSTGALSGNYNYRVLVKKNGTNVWGNDFSAIAISSGVLNQKLSGNGGNLGAAGNFSAVSVSNVFDNTNGTDVYTAQVIVDINNNSTIGDAGDATFTVDMVAVPLALNANNLAPNGASGGDYLRWNSGTGKWAPATLSSATIPALAVDTANIAANAVTSAKLATGAVDLSTTTVTGILPITAGGTGAASPSAARTALGAGTTGSSIFTASTPAGARSDIGATATGDALITAASASAARTTLGSTATGDSLFTAASATAGRSALGAGATGDSLFTAASVSAARTALNVGATGDSIMTASTAADARSAIGATTVGDALIIAANAAAGRTALGLGTAATSSSGSFAASGANSDITSLTGLSTALSVAQGGTGATSLTSNRVLLGSGTSAITVASAGSSGQVLTSNGSSAPTFQTLNGFGSQSRVSQFEDFFTAIPIAAGANAVGMLATAYGLTQAGGGVAQLTSTASHPGVVRLTLPATASQNHLIAFCRAPGGTLDPSHRFEATSETFTFEAMVRLSSVANNTGMVRVGLFDTFNVTSNGPKGVYFEQLGAASPTWSGFVKNVSNSSPASPPTATTSWTRLTIVYDGTNASFYVNGSLVGAAVANTNLPTATGLCPGIAVSSLAAGMVTRNVDVDYISYTQSVSGR